MIIVCPHCQTRYEIGDMTFGSAGRKVQCAHCNEAWMAVAEPEPPARPVAGGDALFSEDQESALDVAFSEEEQAFASDDARPAAAVSFEFGDDPDEVDATVSEVDPNRLQRNIARRQQRMLNNLPQAKIRRWARTVSVLSLCVVLAVAFFGRTALVRQYPDLAGIYEMVGLQVNTVGLEFTDIRTLRTTEDGIETMEISARLYGVTNQTVPVPPVVVTLLNAEGQSLYQWSVTTDMRTLGVGEVTGFTTRLSDPPANASRVKLSFAMATVQTAPGR